MASLTTYWTYCVEVETVSVYMSVYVCLWGSDEAFTSKMERYARSFSHGVCVEMSVVVVGC